MKELEAKLQDLYEGRQVVSPCNADHAYNMLMVAGSYIHHDKWNVWNYLKEDKK